MAAPHDASAHNSNLASVSSAITPPAPASAPANVIVSTQAQLAGARGRGGGGGGAGGAAAGGGMSGGGGNSAYMKPPLRLLLTAHDFEEVARQVLNKHAWVYYSSGAYDEITLRENCAAFQRIW